MDKKEEEKIKPAQLHLKIDKNGELEVIIKGNKIDLVRLLSLSIVEYDDLKDIVGKAMFTIMAVHLKSHGIDIQEILEQAVSEAKQRTEPKEKNKKRSVN